jgi:trehalose/maltose hydrolase-like predicted phosphorylase
MAGTVILALKAYAGLDVSGEQIEVAPRLPAAWRKVSFSVGFRGDRYHFVVTPGSVRVNKGES